LFLPDNCDSTTNARLVQARVWLAEAVDELAAAGNAHWLLACLPPHSLADMQFFPVIPASAYMTQFCAHSLQTPRTPRPALRGFTGRALIGWMWRGNGQNRPTPCQPRNPLIEV